MSAGGRGCGRVCGVIARRINRASADTHPENSTNPVICCCVWLRITARQSLRNFRNYMHCTHTLESVGLCRGSAKKCALN